MPGFGSILKDYLQFYKISQKDFADRLGISVKHMNEILNENADISVELMLGIGLITNIDPNLIFNIENEKRIGNNLLKKYNTKKEIFTFLNSFALKEMVEKKWITLRMKDSFSTTAVDLLEFLSMKDFENIDNYMKTRVLFKKHDEANMKKIFLWIKHCDKKIEGKQLKEYKSADLPFLFQELISERIKPFNEKRLINIFNKYGIYLVIEDALKGTKVRGCTMVKDKNPAIYITKFLKEKASFYYVLYHELGHVKSEYNKAKGSIIVDDVDELEYDLLSLKCMIDDNIWQEIMDNYEKKDEICKANKIPLCFLYSRLAYEKIIDYKSIEYQSHREVIE